MAVAEIDPGVTVARPRKTLLDFIPGTGTASSSPVSVLTVTELGPCTMILCN